MTAQGATADCPAPAVDVVDTVGAGDSFLAALCSIWIGKAAAFAYNLRQISAGFLLQILQFANRPLPSPVRVPRRSAVPG